MTVETASVKNGWKTSRRLTGRFILWQFIIWVAIKGSASSIALGVERNYLNSQRRLAMHPSDKKLRELLNKAWDDGYKRRFNYPDDVNNKREDSARYRDVSKILKEHKEETDG